MTSRKKKRETRATEDLRLAATSSAFFLSTGLHPGSRCPGKDPYVPTKKMKVTIPQEHR